VKVAGRGLGGVWIGIVAGSSGPSAATPVRRPLRPSGSASGSYDLVQRSGHRGRPRHVSERATGSFAEHRVQGACAHAAASRNGLPCVHTCRICAARPPVVSPAEPGGTRREVPRSRCSCTTESPPGKARPDRRSQRLPGPATAATTAPALARGTGQACAPRMEPCWLKLTPPTTNTMLKKRVYNETRNPSSATS